MNDFFCQTQSIYKIYFKRMPQCCFVHNESQWVRCGVNNNAAVLMTIAALGLQVNFEDLLQLTEDIFDVDLFSCHTSLMKCSFGKTGESEKRSTDEAYSYFLLDLLHYTVCLAYLKAHILTSSCGRDTSVFPKETSVKLLMSGSMVVVWTCVARLEPWILNQKS